MEPVDWGQAFGIVGGGLVVVFAIMSLLALSTHFMGKIFVSLEAKKKQAEAAKKEAEKEAKK